MSTTEAGEVVTLRDEINYLLHGWVGNDDSLVLADDVTDRILAAVREAMLSEPAQGALHEKIHDGMIWDDSENPIPEPGTVAYEFVPGEAVYIGMTAALTAAGITGAGQEGGGE